MLKPNKYTNIQLSVIGLSSEIIKELRIEHTIKYNQLLGRVTHRLGDQAKQNFLLSLTFLFSTGIIEYNHKEDIVHLAKAK